MKGGGEEGSDGGGSDEEREGEGNDLGGKEGRLLFTGKHRLWVRVVVGHMHLPFIGGGHCVCGHSSFVHGGLS